MIVVRARFDTLRLARDERADLAAFLATLPPQQWQAPTLCDGWRVRDVVAHVISYDDLDARDLLACVIQGRLRPGQVNAVALARYKACRPQELLELLTGRLQPRDCPRLWAAGSHWSRGLIHHQDIRRPLGQPRAIPPERLLPALRTALIAPDISGLWRIRGVRLVATDIGFCAGAGPEVRGTAEALLMTIAGRAVYRANYPVPVGGSSATALTADDAFKRDSDLASQGYWTVRCDSVLLACRLDQQAERGGHRLLLFWREPCHDPRQFLPPPGVRRRYQPLAAGGQFEGDHAAVPRVGAAGHMPGGDHPVGQPGDGRPVEAECPRSLAGGHRSQVGEHSEQPELRQCHRGVQDVQAPQCHAGQHARGSLQHLRGPGGALVRCR